MDDEASPEPPRELTPRAPTEKDLISLCRALNDQGAKYMIVGGFAIMMSGYPRTTGDIDILVADDLTNEKKVFEALMTLPDQCVSELEPGDLQKYIVLRVADEILVDLMAKTSGLSFEDAEELIHWQEIQGVHIPFAGPELLWKMKSKTHRAKDQGDLFFLKQWFASQGRSPPQDT